MWIDINLKDKWYYLLHPRPVVVVSVAFNGKETAMAASWCMPVSKSPPLLAVSIAPSRYTYELIKGSKEFIVNVLEYRYFKEVSYLGTVSGRDIPDKIDRSGLSKEYGRIVKAPVFKEAVGVLECKLYKDVEAGDHNVIIGEVLKAYAKESLKAEPDIKKYKVMLQIAGLKYTTSLDTYEVAEV